MAVATSAIVAGTTAVVGAGLSFATASKERKLAEKAQADAQVAFDKADKMLDVNYMEQLSINKAPYEAQQEAANVQAAQMIDQAAGSERGVQATAGNILAQSNVTNEKIRNKQIKDVEALEKAVATEDASLAKSKSDLQLGVAEGAQGVAQDARLRQTQANQAGIQGLGTGLENFGDESVIDLFSYNR